MRAKSKAVLAALLGLALLTTGCGSDDDDTADGSAVEAAGVSDEGSADAPDEGATDDGVSDGEDTGEDEGGTEGMIPSECPAVGTFDGTVERSVDEELGHRAVTLAGSEVTDVIASEFFGLYSVYLADHEVDRGVLDEVLEGSISSDSFDEAPAGSVLVTIGLGDMYADAPTATGDVLSTEGNSLTLMVDSGGGSRMLGAEDTGTAEVLGLTDESICFTIQFQGEEQSVNGIVHAPLYDGTN